MSMDRPWSIRSKMRLAISFSSSRGCRIEVFNVSDTEPVVAVVARSDASEWENIVNFTRFRGNDSGTSTLSKIPPSRLAGCRWLERRHEWRRVAHKRCVRYVHSFSWLRLFGAKRVYRVDPHCLQHRGQGR